jgi:hypothetical protein
MEVALAEGENVGETHPTEVLAFGVAATCMPVGKASLKTTPVSTTLFEFVMVKVSVLFPLTEIVAGEKALEIVGGARTVRLAVAVSLVPPLVELTVTLLVLAPEVVPVMFTENVHALLGLLAVRVAPDRLTVPDPAVAVIVPPAQDAALNPFGVATTSPPDRMSVNVTPVRAVLVFGFVMVKDSVLV